MREVSNPNSGGILPFNPKLLLSMRSVSFVARPNSDGIVPTN